MNFFLVSIIGISISLFIILGYMFINKIEKLNLRTDNIQNKGLFYLIVISFFINLIISMFVIMQFYSTPCKIMETCSTYLSYTFIFLIPLFYLILLVLCIIFVVKSILNHNFERMHIYFILSVIFAVSVVFLIKYFFQFLKPYLFII